MGQNFLYAAKFTVGLTAILSWSAAAQVFDNTKVLPVGVRGVNIRSVETTIDQKTDASGKALPLAAPLQKDLTFGKIVAGETGLKSRQLAAFLLANGFSESEAAGTFQADLRGRVRVLAPIFSYGLTDKTTLAIAALWYRAETVAEMGFVQSSRGDDFIASLASEQNNQIEAAREAATKLNNAVTRLNAKLVANGYREIEDWQQSGIGDLTVAAKARAFDTGKVSGALTTGFVAPTGRVDDPNVLTDIPFGDGQWDVFGQLALDQPFLKHFFFNQFVKYTWQLPSEKTVRDVTADESIEVNNIRTRFKLGDKTEAGASVNYLSPGGVVLGAGYGMFRKFSDRYYDISQPDMPAGERTRAQLAKDTNQYAEHSGLAVGYSTIPAFQRGRFPAPLELKFGLQRQIKSRNMPVTDQAQIDASLFF